MRFAHVSRDFLSRLHQPAGRIKRRLFARLRRQRIKFAHSVAQEFFFGFERGLLCFGL